MLREGARYRDFIDLILAGYDLELMQSDRYNCVLLEEFESSKRLCILPLLSMGYVNFGFALSKKYMCFLGLVVSFENSDGDETLLRDFSSVIHGHFAVTCPSNGGESNSLGGFVLNYLFQRNKLAQMMYICRQLPDNARSQLMKDYLQLQWIHSLDKADFKSAAVQSAAYAATSLHLSASVTISLSKLCAKAGNLDALQTAEIDRQYTNVLALKQLSKLDSTLDYDTTRGDDFPYLLNTIIRKLRIASEDSTTMPDKSIMKDLLRSCINMLKHYFALGKLNVEDLLTELLEVIEMAVSFEKNKWADSALAFDRGSPLTSDFIAFDSTFVAVILHESVDVRLPGQPHPLRDCDLQGKVRDRLNQIMDSAALDLITAYISTFQIRYDVN